MEKKINILEHFDKLVNLGLKIIPLRNNSKAPLCKNWNKYWNLKEIRNKIKKNSECNLGLLLGNIVDVEGDSEESNEIILNLTQDYPHPSYVSSKSIHHLFQTPIFGFKYFKWKKIEFRGFGHQSVLPPSKVNEIEYKWITDFSKVPEMPDSLVRFLKHKIKYKKNNIKKGHIKIPCSNCRKHNFINKKRFYLELEIFKILNQKWLCKKCRDRDVRPLCRLLKSTKNIDYIKKII